MIKWAFELSEAFRQEMEVDGGGFYGRMAKEAFEGVEIRPMVEHMGRKGMPENVKPPAFGDAGFFLP